MLSRSGMPNSLRPHGLQPARLLCLWDFSGKNMGVGCHFLLQKRTLCSTILNCWNHAVPSAHTTLHTSSSGKLPPILQNLAEGGLFEPQLPLRAMVSGDCRGWWGRGKGSGRSRGTLHPPRSGPQLSPRERTQMGERDPSWAGVTSDLPGILYGGLYPARGSSRRKGVRLQLCPALTGHQRARF